MIDKRLLAEAWQIAHRTLSLTVGFSVLLGVSIIGQAFILSMVINRVFLEHARLDDVEELLFALGGIILLRGLFSFGASLTANYVAIAVKLSLRDRLMRHIFTLGPSYTQSERSGELVITATEGIQTLTPYFRDYLPGLFTATLIPMLILLVVLPIDLLTFFVLLVTAPLIPLFMTLIGKAAGALAQQQYATLGRMSAHFLDVMQGLMTLKVLNRSKHQIKTIAHMTGQFRHATLSVLRIAFLSALTLELLSTISIAIIAVEIGLRLLHGNLDFQPALFLLVIAPEFYLPLRALGAKFHAGQDGVAAAERIFTVLDTPLVRQEAIALLPQQVDIHFNKVTCRYDVESNAALNGVSLTIPHGKRIAIVGESGAGKSTIVNLLLRFVEVDSGQIMIGDVPIENIDRHEWRKHIAWVPQRPHLFNTSIADNIRLGQSNAPMDAIIHSAQAANAHEFIIQLPQGYDTLCGERGVRLSGGQAQRIALARAFLKDAPILILDEVTSHLDAEAEAYIEETITRLSSGRTVLMISHRLNMVRTFDQIHVIANGQLVESGTHETLVMQDGLYSQLLNAYWSAK